MARIKLFNKTFDLDSNTFEVVFIIITTLSGAYLGFVYRPENIPFSLWNYMAIVVILSFTVGFGVASLFVWIYKELKKTRKQKN